jgi:hypothetical protein
MIYYSTELFQSLPEGNNVIDFEMRGRLWSDCILRIPPLIEWTFDDVSMADSYRAYEYIQKEKIISERGLQSLVHLTMHADLYIIDNHNHAFSFRWKSYTEKKIWRWSHLIHIDQHSDYAEPVKYLRDIYTEYQSIPLDEIYRYANTVLDIGSFIRPALDCGLVSQHEMILSEYKLLNHDISWWISPDTILDIDLDFRAPEMSIEQYDQTIRRVRKLIALPTTRCITIATSPTYIHPDRALKVLKDILSE